MCSPTLGTVQKIKIQMSVIYFPGCKEEPVCTHLVGNRVHLLELSSLRLKTIEDA